MKVPFTQVANEVLNNKEMSMRAKGLFAYLYSKPDDWNFSSERIAADQKDGRDAVRAGLKELEDGGYLVRFKKGDRRMEYSLKFSNEPMTENPSLSMTEIATVGKSHSGNTRPISNTDKESNKEEESNKDSNGQAVAEILHYFEGVNPAIKRMYGNVTQRAAATRLIDRFGFDSVVRAAKAAVVCLGQPFAPRITTPYELEMSWAKLVAFYQENQNKKFSKGKNIIGL